MNDQTSLRILSAGAPKTGVSACSNAFADASGLACDVEFATAPVIRERISSGAAGADVVVAPVGAMKDFVAAGHVDAATVTPLGSVKVGVVVRNGAREPDVSSVDALKSAVREADAVVFNVASSGQYIETMLADLGLADEIAAKAVRVPNGAAVMEHLAEAAGDAIGFGQITEIRLHDHLGTHLVGPLPDEVGRTTSYAAAVLAGAAQAADARRLTGFMGTPDGRRLLSESGLIV